MPIPNLIHPIPIEIEQSDRDNTFFDNDAREPVQFVRRKAKLVVDGQVKWESQFDQGHTRVGTTEGASGYVLFRQIDLDAANAGAGIVLALQDRFVKIGLRETDVYVTKLEPVGHYPDTGGHTMIKAFFDDRQPSRQTRG